MLRPRIARPARRSGAALVEFAFVASILVLLLFGIIEYARFVFLLQVAENAAREGARYAVVHTGDGTTQQQVIDKVNERMASRNKELTGYQVEVINVDPDTGAQVPNTAWNQSAFGSAIAVRITGNYKPILPGLIGTASSLPVRIQATMSSEAN